MGNENPNEENITRKYDQEGNVTLEAEMKLTEEKMPFYKRIDLVAKPEDQDKPHLINGNFDVNGPNNITGAENAPNTINGGFGKTVITYTPERHQVPPGTVETPHRISFSQTIEGGEKNDRIIGDAVTDDPRHQAASQFENLTITNPDTGQKEVFRVENGDRDSIDGKGGDDYIDGGAEADIITGGKGSDIIFGGSGDDSIETGTATRFDNEKSEGDVGDINFVDGGAGNDTIRGSKNSQDIIQMSTGNDRIRGTSIEEGDEVRVLLTPRGYTDGRMEVQGLEEGLQVTRIASKDGQEKVLGSSFVESTAKIVAQYSNSTSEEVPATALFNTPNLSLTVEDKGSQR